MEIETIAIASGVAVVVLAIAAKLILAHLLAVQSVRVEAPRD